MIRFYRTSVCLQCKRVQDALEELVVAHQVNVVESKNEIKDESIPANASLPVLIDDGEVVSGSDAILNHLEKLASFKAEWDKFQSDACYCDE